MIQVIWQNAADAKNDGKLKQKIFDFIQKLQKDDTAPGLHIEPIRNSKDQRVRTGRVDQFWRAVLFKFTPARGNTTYVYAGTWPHDEAIDRAKRMRFRTDPAKALPIIDLLPHDETPAMHHEQPQVQSLIPEPLQSLLEEHKFLLSDLTERFGFDESLAKQAFACTSEEELIALSNTLTTVWQAEVLLGMGAGLGLHEIEEALSLTSPAVDASTEEDDDAQAIASMQHPAARMQFYFAENDEDLRQVIEQEDFGAWRVFLHPQQRAYVERDYNGPFRLSGGAGTGKTVVLLHRALALQKKNPDARILLTTFSRSLAANLLRDIERLNPHARIAHELGHPGIHVLGVDQLSYEIRQRAGDSYAEAMTATLGTSRGIYATLQEPQWRDFIDESRPTDGSALLPHNIRTPEFFAEEYSQIILPQGITESSEYLRARRTGRGQALDRKKRLQVWDVLQLWRKNAALFNQISYSELAACSARWLQDHQQHYADHLLVDEGQDLEPAKWQLLRAAVPAGKNDLFIADDSHQRIYGFHTVFSRYGIEIRGRSRRLTLNYRTTHETLRYALGLLEGVTYTDAEGEELTLAGYRSARSGPEPQILTANHEHELVQLLAEHLLEWNEQEQLSTADAILVATNRQAERLRTELASHGIEAHIVKGHTAEGSRLAILTMQRSKGIEFSRVVLYNVSETAFPPQGAVRGLEGEELAEKLKQFRSQLYVAASRARDELVVTWAGTPSPLLEER